MSDNERLRKEYAVALIDLILINPGANAFYLSAAIQEKLLDFEMAVCALRTAGSEREKALREAIRLANSAWDLARDSGEDHLEAHHLAMEAISALLTNPAQDQIANVGETPRTDAAIIDESNFSDWGTGPSNYVEADFARQLEMELNAKYSSRDAACTLLSIARDMLHHTECRDGDATRCAACSLESSIDAALQSRGEGK